MYRNKLILTYAFALFAMFFGSGNLVFPIQIGQAAGQHWILGFCGLFITGIALPFLGLFVVKLHKGSYTNFFGEAGGLAKLVLPLFILSLLGSFGVVPRCITVAHGGLSYLIPDIPFSIFNAVFCLATFIFCIKDERMISAIGKWMSPTLIITLVVLIGFGIISANSSQFYEGNFSKQQNKYSNDLENWNVKQEVSERSINQVREHANSLKFYEDNFSKQQSSEAFAGGFFTGYQTMDLFAAFFFSSLIFLQIKKSMNSKVGEREIIKFSIKSSVLGAILLSLVYLGLVFLGAHFANIIENIEPEFMLSAIAKHILGAKAALFIGISILLSCLTTAVALNNIYARYLCSLFRVKTNRYPFILAATTILSYLVSLFDFQGIAAFLTPLLELSYPSIIALTVLSTLNQNKWYKLKMLTFYGILVIMIFKI